MVSSAGGFEQLRHVLCEIWYMYKKGNNCYDMCNHGTLWYLWQVDLSSSDMCYVKYGMCIITVTMVIVCVIMELCGSFSRWV